MITWPVIPITTLIVWTFRTSIKIRKKDVPVIALLVAIVLTFMSHAGLNNGFNFTVSGYVEIIFQGIINGFSAIGMWEGKKVILPTKST